MVYSRLGRQEEEEASMKRVDELLTKHIELHPDDLRSRSIWSANQVELGAFEKATVNADQVMKLGPSDPSTLYNIACTYAVAGKKEKALDVLAKAVGVGFSDPDWLTSDPQLDPIRDDERFKSLLSSM
jgi:Flp pilus assembly protein TadD